MCRESPLPVMLWKVGQCLTRKKSCGTLPLKSMSLILTLTAAPFGTLGFEKPAASRTDRIRLPWLTMMDTAGLGGRSP